jgi:hypothetical protein
MADGSERNALIVELRRTGATLEQLSVRFGITPQAICKILQGRDPAQGRPCPQCAGNSRTIRTYPPEPAFTRRLHQCRECGHKWLSRQYDDPTLFHQPHM